MVAGVVPGTQGTRRDAGWKWLVLTLCGVSFLSTLALLGDVFGAGGRPWFGWWDAIHVPTGQPFVLRVAGERPDGASAAAGLHTGDLIDLRDQPRDARIGIVYQPLATRETTVHVSRGSRALDLRVFPSTAAESEPQWKEPPPIVQVVANLWFILCASIIALRRWFSREARVLALVLLCLTFTAAGPTNAVTPSLAATISLFLLSSAGWLAAFVLLIWLSSTFGAESRARRVLEGVAYAAALSMFLADVATVIGLTTLWIDPLPYALVVSSLRGTVEVVVAVILVVTVAVAISATPMAERPRAAWLLLPLPVAFVGRDLALMIASFVNSWFANDAVITVGLVCMLVGALTVTYALLKRRVLDLEFVLSRTVVVATVSVIVVASFALLEWILGTALAGVSHATGLIANGALALALGLSLNPIHKRVDSLVDVLLFRKRHDDERGLREFSKEAAYLTEADALLDQAIEKVQRHTDASGAALLLDGNGRYEAARAFGRGDTCIVSENDSAILALKTWRRPLDPHHYATGLQGALALPMLVRGRLLGVLVLGERTGGEAYAPDEVQALAEVAYGVGTAMDGLSADRGQARLADTQEKILDELRLLPRKLAEFVDRNDGKV
jgi:hypothetical protein